MQLTDIALSIVLLVILALGWAQFRRARMRIIAPLPLFLSSWIIMLLFLFLGMVQYEKVFSVESCVVTAMALLAFIGGAMLANRKVTASPGSTFIRSVRYRILPESLFVIATSVYVAIIIFDTMILSDGTLGMSLEDLRALHWEDFWSRKTSMYDVSRSVCRSVAMLHIVGAPIFFLQRRRKALVVAVAAYVAIGVETYARAARGLFVYSTILLALGYLSTLERGTLRALLIRFRRRIIRGTIAVLVALMFVYVLFVVMPMARNPRTERNFDGYLAMKHDAQIGEWVYKLGSMRGLGWMPAFAYGTSYLSMPPVKNTYFMSTDDPVDEWMYWGVYNFPIFSKVSNLLYGEESWISVRDRIGVVCWRDGYNPNPWATSIRDLLIDFGKVGSILALFLLGYVFQRWHMRGISSLCLEHRQLAMLCSLSAFVMGFTSPIRVPYIGQTLYLALAILLLGVVLGVSRSWFDGKSGSSKGIPGGGDSR